MESVLIAISLSILGSFWNLSLLILDVLEVSDEFGVLFVALDLQTVLVSAQTSYRLIHVRSGIGSNAGVGDVGDIEGMSSITVVAGFS
jgi:hypothetical protein